MKIKSLQIVGLHGNQDYNLNFNDDLNVITGRNGSGKTTILKIIWFLISGNFELVKNDYLFDSVSFTTDSYKVVITKKDNPTVEFYQDAKNILDRRLHDYFKFRPADKTPYYSSSLFCPTYRRVEHLLNDTLSGEHTTSFNDTLKMVSAEFSKKDHRFIVYAGTEDIEYILFKNYTEISEELNHQQDKLNKLLVKKISQSNNEVGTLKEVKQQIEELQQKKDLKMQPFTYLKKALQKFFKDKNVNIGNVETLSLGNPELGINSNLLSAGEKQVLSFFVYNAFYQDTIFIIDEPEISLHGDWQRMLIPTLLEQNPSNQFIIATHSPFIYSKYPDKELRLVVDRGNNERKRASVANE